MLLGLEMSGADTGNWLAGDAGFRGIAFTGGMNVNFIPGPGASISGYYMYFSKRV
jgi:hypothetical protein